LLAGFIVTSSMAVTAIKTVILTVVVDWWFVILAAWRRYSGLSGLAYWQIVVATYVKPSFCSF